METQNEKVVETTSAATENTGRRVGIKMIIIFVLSLLLIIPMEMIEDLIYERKRTSEDAIEKVTGQWCAAQQIVGPTLTIPKQTYSTYTNVDGEESKVKSVVNVRVLPKKLDIKGDIQNKIRKKGIYQISLFSAPIEMNGFFELSEEMQKCVSEMDDVDRSVTVELALSDLKGITDEMKITIAGTELDLKPDGNGLLNETSQISAKVNLGELQDLNKIPFSMKFNIKGSQSIKFVPIGEMTTVALTSNATTPSFTGNFLPDESSVADSGFTCNWKISYLNRNYPQQISTETRDVIDAVRNSAFGVDLLIPVQHYQQSLRCTKYAMLFIMLTFAVFFFVEHIQQKNIHPIQYLLVGLALTLFYSLLISLSEHLGFVPAYAVASVMTIAMLTVYTAAVLRIKKTAFYIGGILTVLYVYIFVLIRMETYALVAGSVGLFFILAGIMYLSQKVDWNRIVK